MNNEQDINQLEMSIEAAKELIKLAEACERLKENKDFKSLILDGYFKEHAIRLVMLRGDTNVPDDIQAKILKDIDAIGALRKYLQKISNDGNSALQAVRESEETIESILAGDE